MCGERVPVLCALCSEPLSLCYIDLLVRFSGLTGGVECGCLRRVPEFRRGCWLRLRPRGSQQDAKQAVRTKRTLRHCIFPTRRPPANRIQPMLRAARASRRFPVLPLPQARMASSRSIQDGRGPAPARNTDLPHLRPGRTKTASSGNSARLVRQQGHGASRSRG